MRKPRCAAQLAVQAASLQPLVRQLYCRNVDALNPLQHVSGFACLLHFSVEPLLTYVRPLFYQAVLLTSASSSGLRLMVPSMVASVVSAVTGPSIAWSRRLKWPLVSGVTCYVCGTLCLCFLHRDVPSTLSIVALVPFAVGQGFLFPGTFIAMLATSEQSELAVATTTLLLWRSLGMVVGIAGSSVVVQNALLHYLDVFVQGGGKSRVISQVRASVEAVALLESPYREQAIHSYESALRVTFVGCAVMAAAAALLISPIKLPRLGAK